MHPQIRMPEPGQCPICAMDLIPVVAEGVADELGPRQIRLSATARKLASIQVASVQRRFVPVETRLVGKIAVDETRRRYITAWIPGRIDRLYVDYTGIPVRKGDHMAYLYSPELLSAQEELIQALKAEEQLRSNEAGAIGGTARQTVDAAREKLRLWGLKPGQIAEIERKRRPSDHLTIHAPAGGVVIEKHLSEGAYVQTGTRIYTIADLSQVWLELDAYESDLVWLRYGQEMEFETEAEPGARFKGRIAFISPVLDEVTRTVKVRVNVPNADSRLKPGMFARAVVRAEAAADGRVMDPDLAGKWISPMHPEIVKDGPGTCDICGMPLVKAESLGYVSVAAAEQEAPLVVPASAVLTTGRRAVVYVAVPANEGVFEGREIVLGPRAGEYYLVKEGLLEGERVVVNGSFKVDSALQILARPSMMNPEGGGPAPGHDHGGHAAPSGSQGGGEAHAQKPAADDHADHAHAGGEERFAAPAGFQEQLAALFSAYFEVQQGLSQDDFGRSARGVEALAEALEAVDMALLEGEAHMAWMEQLKELRKSSAQLRQAGDMEQARAVFEPLSDVLAAVAGRFGTGRQEPVYRFFCPMAFDNRGAHWLQEAEKTENPYFGSRMYRCGSQKEVFIGGGKRHE